MINPSAQGWVDKYFFKLSNHAITTFDTPIAFYEATRSSGFLVGYPIYFAGNSSTNTSGLSIQEICKIALLNTLYGVYKIKNINENTNDFINICNSFYKQLLPKENTFLQGILPSDSSAQKLEKYIDARVQTNNNIISKNFSHILTNALLFIDVLAFNKFLQINYISENYCKKSEDIIVNIVALALQTKKTATKYDLLLQKFFQASVRYTKFKKIGIEPTLESLDLSYFTDDFEKYYLIDIATIALWSDGVIEEEEKLFLYNLAKKINVNNLFVAKSITDMNCFLTTHKASIPYFNYSNPIRHFYQQTTQTVQTLIARNKNRLMVEVSQSKELMLLLTQSTIRELNSEEKKKVKTQLLDICKTIPSLAVFLVPGGSLLLPLLIKFIPQILPSAFNENLNKVK